MVCKYRNDLLCSVGDTFRKRRCIRENVQGTAQNRVEGTRWLPEVFHRSCRNHNGGKRNHREYYYSLVIILMSIYDVKIT